MGTPWRTCILLTIQTLWMVIKTDAFLSVDFNNCKEHFKDKFLPENFPKSISKVEICQQLEGTIYYATMYNLNFKMPLYSAYKMKNVDSKDTGEDLKKYDLKKWMVELGLSNMGGDMGDEGALTKEEKKLQAINKDYIDAVEPVVRGQMAPKTHMNEKASRLATFTLTNAAPFFEKFQAVWRIVEQETRKLMEKKCSKGTAYFITGTVPGLDKVPEKVNIPTHAYTAAACEQDSSEDIFSFGIMGQNEEVEGEAKNVLILVTDVITLGGKVIEKWGDNSSKQPIKFFKDNGNAEDKTAVKELKEALRKRGVNVVDVDF